MEPSSPQGEKIWMEEWDNKMEEFNRLPFLFLFSVSFNLDGDCSLTLGNSLYFNSFERHRKGGKQTTYFVYFLGRPY